MTNALLESAQLDKKAEIVLSDGTFAEIFHIKACHLLLAEDSSEMKKMLKLIIQTVYIDDMPMTMTQALELKYKDLQAITIQMFK
jgi:hypothetical protein